MMKQLVYSIFGLLLLSMAPPGPGGGEVIVTINEIHLKPVEIPPFFDLIVVNNLPKPHHVFVRDDGQLVVSKLLLSGGVLEVGGNGQAGVRLVE